MEYEKPFWDKGLNELYPIIVPNDGQTVKSALNDISESNWAEHLAYFETFKRHPNLLVAWIGGDVFSENLSDEEVSRDITEYLRRLLGKQDIPEPKSIKRSRWNSNQYFRGSYTNMPLGSFKEDFSKIAEPIYLNDVSKLSKTIHQNLLTGLLLISFKKYLISFKKYDFDI